MNILTSKTAICAALCAASYGAWEVGALPRIHESTSTSLKPSKNLAREGDIQGAMDQARNLLAQMKDHNWDARGVDPQLLMLPDQSYAQSPLLRRPGTLSFMALKLQPIYEEVAFYSLLYVVNNIEIVPGVEGVNHPEGFVIVGWKDNRGVTQVPIGDVRLLPNPDGSDSRLFVFPGMNEYSNSLPVYGHPE